MTQEAMKLALEALEADELDMVDDGSGNMIFRKEQAITAIKQALAKHAMREVQRLGQEIDQEPVALPCCGYTDASAVKWNPFNNVVQCHNCGQVYATPPQRTEQEPLAWMDADGNVSDNNDHKCFPIPLYTQPPQRTWANLPDEEIKILWIQYRAALPRYLCFAKALLARSKEKNT